MKLVLLVLACVSISSAGRLDRGYPPAARDVDEGYGHPAPDSDAVDQGYGQLPPGYQIDRGFGKPINKNRPVDEGFGKPINKNRGGPAVDPPRYPQPPGGRYPPRPHHSRNRGGGYIAVDPPGRSYPPDRHFRIPLIDRWVDAMLNNRKHVSRKMTQIVKGHRVPYGRQYQGGRIQIDPPGPLPPGYRPYPPGRVVDPSHPKAPGSRPGGSRVDPGYGKPAPIDPGYGVDPPVDPGYGVDPPEVVDPDFGMELRELIDPGFGQEGPVDPGFGQEGPVDPLYGQVPNNKRYVLREAPGQNGPIIDPGRPQRPGSRACRDC